MNRDLHIPIWKFAVLSIFIYPNINAFSLDSLKSSKNISEYSHRSWDSKNGFLPYSINTILQTRDDYIWIGTDEGLVRFDGLGFSAYNTNNTKAFKTNNVSSIVEDKDGRLWIGCTDGGLLSYFEGSFTYYFIKDQLKDDRISSMCLDHENNLWIGTPSNLSFISLTEMQKQTPDEKKTILKISGIDFLIYYTSSMFCDDSGTVWGICKGNMNIFYISPGKKGKILTFGDISSNHMLTCFLSDSKGRNWVGTSHGLKVLKNDNLSLYSAKNGTIEFKINTIIEDRTGILWIGTYGNGLYKLDSAGYLKKISINEGKSPSRAMSFFEDKEGGLWVGFRGEGIYRFQKKIFRNYTIRDGLSDNRVWSICETHNNDIWIGTQKGLNKLSFGKSREVLTRLPIPGDERDNVVRTIIEDHNNVIWIGAGKGILRYSNGKLKRFLSTIGTRSMVVDSNNSLWIGGAEAGLVKVQKESYKKYYFLSPENLSLEDKNFFNLFFYQVKTLCYDNKGDLWIGTKIGLYRFSGDSIYYFDKTPGLTGNAVMTLFNDSKGTLWITVYGFGLFRFNPGKGEKQFSQITRNNGLQDNTIFSILEDNYGKFWFGTNKGISSANRQEIVDFCDGKISSVQSITYGLDAGMESIECNGGNHPSAIKSKDGRLWFPTMSGVVVVDPGNLYRQQNPLKVYIQKTVVDGVELSTNRFHPLEPGNKRKIEFHYTAINFSTPENVRFKYRLEDYDDEWIDARNQRTIYYLNIPPGLYTFRVLACNNEGVWNTDEASISFEIPPHFWETGLFKISFGILLLGIIIGITRIIYSRKLKHQLYILEKQRALEQERLRISRDIHDEIGSRLTKISVLNEAVKDGIDKVPVVRAYTEKISNETKQVIENLDEIIWFINPGNDSIELLGTFLREYIADYFSSTDIVCICDFPDSYPAMQISPEVRRNIVLTVKEITNNIVKHASASKVNTKFDLQEQSILISLEDNGKGFSTQEPHPLGNGLLNIQKRIEEIGGRVIIKSVMSSGTEIQIFLPLINT
ncbi:MAG: hypothetical protein C0412_10220 [Flavobacterium sp.]|nr:hypothetical protein [Flavobacterium sp.]